MAHKKAAASTRQRPRLKPKKSTLGRSSVLAVSMVLAGNTFWFRPQAETRFPRRYQCLQGRPRFTPLVCAVRWQGRFRNNAGTAALPQNSCRV